jgi:subtilisin family serine protease
MQGRQTRVGHLQQQAKTQLLTLTSTLALVLGSGCHEESSLNHPQQGVSAPIEGANLTSPIVSAPPQERIPGEYIVVFADETSKAAIELAANRVSQAGGSNGIIHQYSVIPGFAARLDDVALSGLRRTPGVAYIAENQRVQLNATFPSPADGIDRADQRQGHDGTYDDHGRTGAGVHVYVLDTGLNTRHAEFTGRIGGGYTAIADGRGIEDCNGHGTHVSSTAAGTVYGMAKQATIHPVRVLDCGGSGTWDGVIAGLDFVRNDCLGHKAPCVANMSLGGGKFPAVDLAVANTVNSGITVVVAAGNWNTDACTVSPAAEPSALTVAAMDDADTRAWFSDWGTCVDLFAPGVTIQGAWIGGTTAVRTIDGTSMASPHVAGAVAQFLSSNPGATPAQVEANIEGAANLECVGDPRGSPNVMLFNDLSQGNYTCSNQPASCQGLCGGVGNGCFCDEQCEVYNDCCDDYDQVCR